ncbi:MAG TPA: protocatechuate 3,4-dioxygenase subunit alpha [Vicinamibacterales bacterium]|nr:protocatechuate 3,4-dioxygenase subunit alpha [Vicinamibacterales bacterium]
MSRAPVRLTASPSQTVGPFFHFGLADNAALGRLAGPHTTGDRILLDIGVFDGDGVPVPDSLIEIWQADADGTYVRPESPDAALPPPEFTGFGRLPTGPDGVCRFETIRPGRVADAQGALQAPHINVCLFARGLLRQLFTRIYFADDPALAADAIFQLVPADRRETLLASRVPGAPCQWRFDIRLQGDRETVFFDL